MESVILLTKGYSYVGLIVAVVWFTLGVLVEKRAIIPKLIESVRKGLAWPYTVFYEALRMVMLDPDEHGPEYHGNRDYLDRRLRNP